MRILLVLIMFSLGSIGCQRISKLSRYVRSLSDNKSLLKTDYQDFVGLLKPILIERVVDTPGSRIVQNYITSKMKEYGWIVEQNPFREMTPFGEKNFVNIVANYPIGVNFKSDEVVTNITLKKDFSSFHTNNRIVLACHYDSKFERDFKFIGAIDSAVPCAIMLELAKFLKENFEKNEFSRLSRHLQFIFFDGEEAFDKWTDTDSIYGARNHANQLMKNYSQDAFDSIDLFVLLDLIGGTESRFLNFFPATSNTYKLLTKIETTLLKKGLLNTKKNYYFTNTQGLGGNNGGIQDDHLPFLAKNVPILHLIPVPFPDQWHKPDDNFENLNQSRIEDIRMILKIFLMHILNKSQDHQDEIRGEL